jgi:uncharacterized protein (DUF362 family)
MQKFDRRQFAALLLSAPASLRAAPPGAVAIARCPSYDLDQTEALGRLFDQLGGLDGLVKGKSVTVKLNLTGSPANRLQGRSPALTHYTHPRHVAAMIHLLARAQARRIRFVESAWASVGPLEETMLDAGWNVRQLKAIAPNVEFVNTNGIGPHRSYARFAVPGRALVFPSYELHRAYAETDVFVSMAKLKEHDTCGVTLAMKNIFGITPASVYGDDAGLDEPNERPEKGRLDVCHFGKRAPSKNARPELNPSSSRDPGDRMPRITAELCAARPIHLSFIDGIQTVAGGEGPWVKGLRPIAPGLLIAGLNPVGTDTVATALMGFDPRAPQGQGAFAKCANTLLLAEELGLGVADLKQIEVRGVAWQDAVFRFRETA